MLGVYLGWKGGENYDVCVCVCVLTGSALEAERSTMWARYHHRRRKG